MGMAALTGTVEDERNYDTYEITMHLLLSELLHFINHINMKITLLLIVSCLSPFVITPNDALQQPSSPLSPNYSLNQSRRQIISIPKKVGAAILTSSPVLTKTGSAANAAAETGLAAKLSKRDASVLKNSVFNIPPSTQTYPQFMRGKWDISLSFAGYLFPSQSIPKDKIVSNVNIPGFQKCSIASIADVGREGKTTYRMEIMDNGYEDRVQTLKSSIGSHLGYDAVDNISYDPNSNPNRLSIDFAKYKTRNAERIELFCNARESELVSSPNNSDGGRSNGSDLKIFVNSEYIRQVTFSLSQEFGVARQVIGNYAHFWTWREQPEGQTMKGNVLTACYLDPQDAMFFQEPSKPVAVYSHQITANRV